MKTSIGIGCPTCGGCDGGMGGAENGGSVATWRNARIVDIAAVSPALALARARGDMIAPYILNMKATFSDPSVSNIPNVGFEGGGQGGTISQDTIVDRVMFEIDSPNLSAGQYPLKPQGDYFFGLQSGITATMDVIGAPRYSISPFYTPIRALCAMINEGWPMGWILKYTQSVKMSFNLDQSLPSLPTRVTVSFRMWAPVTDGYQRMSNKEAFDGLAKIGIVVPDYIVNTVR
jgi:hypothetical protein